MGIEKRADHGRKEYDRKEGDDNDVCDEISVKML
jgi:hypothetical protein